MKSTAILLIGLLAVSACRQADSTDKPAVITDDSLVTLLVDLHLADSVNNSLNPADIAAKGIDTTFEGAVLEKHHISHDEFRAIMRYHIDHPDGLVKIYDRVIENLNQRQRPVRN